MANIDDKELDQSPRNEADAIHTAMKKRTEKHGATAEKQETPPDRAPAQAGKAKKKAVSPVSVAVMLLIAGAAGWFFTRQEEQKAPPSEQGTVSPAQPEPNRYDSLPQTTPQPAPLPEQAIPQEIPPASTPQAEQTPPPAGQELGSGPASPLISVGRLPGEDSPGGEPATSPTPAVQSAEVPQEHGEPRKRDESPKQGAQQKAASPEKTAAVAKPVPESRSFPETSAKRTPQTADGSIGAKPVAQSSPPAEHVPVSGRIISMYREDSVVRMGFVEDLAQVLVENYWPAHTRPGRDNSRGIITTDIVALNRRYGANLTGLHAKQAQGTENQALSRARVYTYVMSPSMIEALEKLYADNFMRLVRNAAHNQARSGRDGVRRALTQAEYVEMYSLYASDFKKTASALHNYAGTPNAYSMTGVWQDSESKTQRANLAYIEAQSDNPESSKTAALGRAYQAAVAEREKARGSVVAMMSYNEARQLDAETLLYIASWAKRRGPAASASIEACASLLDRMAERFKKATEE